jgi:hypothetical protein
MELHCVQGGLDSYCMWSGDGFGVVELVRGIGGGGGGGVYGDDDSGYFHLSSCFSVNERHSSPFRFLQSGSCTGSIVGRHVGSAVDNRRGSCVYLLMRNV